ncbi:MAG: aldose 1-epimerase family protein [Eubacteriales bacterium]
MYYTIQNKYLKVVIESKGAELWSIMDQEQCEYLWQGDSTYWGNRSPLLFPYVGRLTDGKYSYKNHIYEMCIHGFANLSEFLVIEQRKDCITFLLEDSMHTREQYPFTFALFVQYCLHKNKVLVEYRVENKGNTTMYFGIGGHPGFYVPMEEGLTFSDYSLEFSENTDVYRVGMSEDCYVNGKDEPFDLEEGVRLPLEHSMFDEDAIILRDMAKSVLLNSLQGKKSIRVNYKEMPYLGIWHMPKIDAPYICIEPWSSLPSRKDMIEDLEKKEDLIALSKKECYVTGWEVEVGSMYE